jgi:predicted nucleic-acid-binding protein
VIGLDTNVVVRFLVQDHPAQSKKAAALFSSFTAEIPGFISLLTLAEVVWVLRSCYQVSRVDIADMVQEMLISRDIQFEHADLLPTLVRNYRDGRADFSDYAIAAIHRHSGCTKTVTFDRVAAKSTAMELL